MNSNDRDQETSLSPLPSVSTADVLLDGTTNCMVGRDEEKAKILQAFQQVQDTAKTKLVILQGAIGTGKTALGKSIKEHVESNGQATTGGIFVRVFCRARSDVSDGPNPIESVSTKGLLPKTIMDIVERASCRLERHEYRALSSDKDEDSISTVSLSAGHPVAQAAAPSALSRRTLPAGASDPLNSMVNVLNSTITRHDKCLVLFLDDFDLPCSRESSNRDGGNDDDVRCCPTNDLLLSSLLTRTSRVLILVATTTTTLHANATNVPIAVQCHNTCAPPVLLLGDLSYENVASLLSKILAQPSLTKNLQDDKLQSILAPVVWEQTGGNPLFIRHYLWATHCQTTGTMENEADVASDAAIMTFESIQDVIRHNVNHLSPHAKEVLQWLACLCANSNRVERRVVHSLLGKEIQTRDEVTRFVSLDQCSDEYEFVNQVVHDVVYDMVPDCALIHCHVGRQLARKTKDVTLVVNHLLRGEHYVLQHDAGERKAAAEMCLLSGQLHMKKSQFQTAFDHLSFGVRLVGDDGWRESYRLCVELHNAVAEVAYSTGRFDELELHVQETMQHALCFHDTLRAQATRVYSLGAQDQVEHALALAFDVLRKLGEPVPVKTPSKQQMARTLQKTNRRLANKTNEFILRLSVMHSEEKLAAMQMYNLIFLYVFAHRQEYASWVAFRMVSLTLDHGISAPSCVGFALYAALLCCFGSDIDSGFRYGQLSFSLYEKFKSSTWLGRITAVYYGAVHGWKRPYDEAIEPLQHAQKLAISSGDIEFGMLNANVTIWCQLDLLPIPSLLDRIRSFSAQMTALGQAMNLTMIQAALNLLKGFGGQPLAISYEELESMKDLNQGVYLWSHFVGLMQDYVMGDIDAAVRHRNCCKMLIDNPFGCGDMGMILLFDGLISVELAREGKLKRSNLRVVKKQIKLLRMWANKAPDNQLAKLNLLEAEFASLSGDESAYSKYKSAIALSKEGGFFLMTALAFERTGRFFLRSANARDAAPYLQEAVQRYKDWGAVRKANHLQHETNEIICSSKLCDESTSSSHSFASFSP